MMIYSEEQILNEEFRRAVIEEINGAENQKRKLEAKRRYDCFKDKTKDHVLKAMLEETGDKNQLMAEIKNRISNVSFTRKIIDKKSIVYKDPAVRISANQQQTDQLSSELNIDSTMKKTNKYVELFKNTLVQIVPWQNYSWELSLRTIPPFAYDVLSDARNPEKMKVVILSYQDASTELYYKDNAGIRNEPIAGTSKSSTATYYIWWSNAFHFTTNDKGQIIDAPEGLLNPFQILPFTDFSVDQDGKYWSEGGDDIVDAGVLLNVLLTDLYYISKFQGMGIFYLIGKGIPQEFKVGPSSGIFMEKVEGDPETQIGFATSNPPIADHLSLIEQYVAFILSTNNLEPSSISSSLGVSNANSGVQEMIKRSENIEDIEDQQELYKDQEPDLYKKIAKVYNYYYERNLLDSKYNEIGKIVDDKITLKFTKPEIYTSEMDKLNVIEKRLQLGLDSMLEAVKRDNPELSEEEAQEKLRKMMEEKLLKASQQMREVLNGNESIEDDLQN